MAKKEKKENKKENETNNKKEDLTGKRKNKYNIVEDGKKSSNKKENAKKTDKKSLKGKTTVNTSVKPKPSFVIYFSVSVMIIAILTLVFLYIKDNYLLFSKRPTMTIELEDLGSFTAELYPEKAPNTVAYIVRLAESGFFDGKIIYGKDAFAYHLMREEDGSEPRVTASMIDNNIPKGSVYDYECEIDGEFEKNDFKGNDLLHEKYTLSLTRADYSQIIKNLQKQSFNSGTPMFKVLYKDAPGMNGYYAAFGKVIEGQNIIDKLEERELRFDLGEEDLSEFKEFVKIKKVTIDGDKNRLNKIKIHKRFSLEEFLIDFYNKNKTVQ